MPTRQIIKSRRDKKDEEFQKLREICSDNEQKLRKDPNLLFKLKGLLQNCSDLQISVLPVDLNASYIEVRQNFINNVIIIINYILY
jgi:hypothetical protein